MHWFCKEGITVSQSCRAFADLACNMLLEGKFPEVASLANAAAEFAKSHADEESAKVLARALKDLPVDQRSFPTQVLMAIRVLHCLPRAVFADNEGREVDAWKLVASAGISCGAGLGEAIHKREKRQAAVASHREDVDSKGDVFNWLDKNASSYSSMNAMAREIDRLKLVPYAFRTVLKWVGEWKRQE